MKTSLSLIRDDACAKVFLKRVFLPKDTDKEALALYTEILNDFPSLPKGKNFYSLAGAEVSFSSYAYNGGYVLEGKLHQTSVKNLNYIFKNPYKEGLDLFLNLFENGFSGSEEELALVKERVAYQLSQVKQDPLLSLASELSLPYVSLPLEEEKLKTKTSAEIQAFEKVIASSKKGDVLYYGPEKKNLVYPEPEEKMLTEGYICPAKDMEGDFGETVYLYSFTMKKIESGDDFLAFEAFEDAYAMALKKYLAKYLGSEVDVSYQLLTSTSFALVLKTEKDKITYLGKNNPFEPYVALPVEVPEEVLSDRLRVVSSLESEEILLSRARTTSDLGLEDLAFLLEEKDVSKEKVEEIWKSLKLLTASHAKRKEPVND